MFCDTCQVTVVLDDSKLSLKRRSIGAVYTNILYGERVFLCNQCCELFRCSSKGHDTSTRYDLYRVTPKEVAAKRQHIPGIHWMGGELICSACCAKQDPVIDVEEDNCEYIGNVNFIR